MRIVWLAVADARGHLMRAQLARQLLAPYGVRTDIVTTSMGGVAFLEAMGCPSTLLSTHWAVAFDASQNIDRARTEACALRYLCSPSRGVADCARLADLARGATALVNDFHPLLLVAGGRVRRLPPVVHLYGEHLWRSIEHAFAERGPALLDRTYASVVRALRDRAPARIEHSLAPRAVPALRLEPENGALDVRLPPLVASPARTAADVRAQLGVASGARLCAVYLNPHFTDPELAASIEDAVRGRGMALHAVGEGFAGRRGWLPFDPAFTDVAAAADVLVSAPGMGALGLVHAFGTPFVALSTDQPEQRANLAFLSAPAAPPSTAVSVAGADLAGRVGAGLDELLACPHVRARDAAAATSLRHLHRAWTQALLDVLGHLEGGRASPATIPALRAPDQLRAVDELRQAS